MNNESPVLGAIVLLLITIGVYVLLAWALGIKEPLISYHPDNSDPKNWELPWWVD